MGMVPAFTTQPRGLGYNELATCATYCFLGLLFSQVEVDHQKFRINLLIVTSTYLN